MFEITESKTFETGYPDASATLGINVDTPLLKRGRLIELANALPPHLVEFNPGDLPVTVSADNIPSAALSVAETIEKIGTVKSWMVLRNIEKDPNYREMMRNIVSRFAPTIQSKTGEIKRCEAFVFISSPGAVTPFHIDEEHNILIQVEGSKTFTIYSQDDRDLASQTDLEAFHSGGHRNLTVTDPDLLARGTPVEMKPGDAIYVPPLAPHWVKVTGDQPSLSLSITWRSNASERQCYLHQINHTLRAKGGNPKFPGADPVADQLKIWKASAKNRVKKLLPA